jgi:ethanolamine utilization microcompartment shell protein EutS
VSLIYEVGEYMDIRIIKSPTEGSIEILNRRRILAQSAQKAIEYDTIGLIQGKLIDMVVAADIAEKYANIEVEEIRGICPQHFAMIALFGDTASVEAALKAIQDNLGNKSMRGEGF